MGVRFACGIAACRTNTDVQYAHVCETCVCNMQVFEVCKLTTPPLPRTRLFWCSAKKDRCVVRCKPEKVTGCCIARSLHSCEVETGSGSRDL